MTGSIIIYQDGLWHALGIVQDCELHCQKYRFSRIDSDLVTLVINKLVGKLKLSLPAKSVNIIFLRLKQDEIVTCNIKHFLRFLTFKLV